MRRRLQVLDEIGLGYLRLGQPATGLGQRPSLIQPEAFIGAQRLDQLHELCPRHVLAVHLDGSRFANAIAALGCTPAEMTWKAGVSAVSSSVGGATDAVSWGLDMCG